MDSSATTIFGVKVTPNMEIGARIVGSLLVIGVIVASGQQIHAHLDLSKTDQIVAYGGLGVLGVAGNSLIWIPWLMKKEKPKNHMEHFRNPQDDVSTTDI